jgi:signal transduction histidine kinase/ActR/RegA family two-component response regulator
MEQRLRLLCDASTLLASTTDLQDALHALAHMIVSTLADWCTITVRDEDGNLCRVAGAHVDPAQAALVAEYLERYEPSHHPRSEIALAVKSGQSLLVPKVSPGVLEGLAHSQEQLAVLRELGCTSAIVASVVAGGVPVGALSLVMCDGKRELHELDHQLARELGALIGIAVENARRRAESEQLLLHAEQAIRAKDEFFAMLGHELRNPLAPILTAIELMRLRGGAPERELAVIERQTRHLTRLVDDLLDVARISRGGVQLAREPVDVAEIVRNAVEMVEALLVQGRHELVIDVERGLVVDADPTRLAQIVSNLVTNAARHSPAGGNIEVHGQRAGERIVLRVLDSGEGIAPELLPHVFDAFVQQRQALDRARGGLGLGLAIVKSLVEAHGGTVRAHSEGIGRGAELVVELPTGDTVRPPQRDTPPVALAPTPALAPARVLVVDDNEDACALLAETLERAGYEVDTAFDGPEALAACTAHAPAAALLDIGLPGMDGYELARRMRALPGFAGVFLVAVTGYGQDTDRARTRQAGFDEHLVKPVTMKQIRAVLAAGIGSSDIPPRP